MKRSLLLGIIFIASVVVFFRSPKSRVSEAFFVDQSFMCPQPFEVMSEKLEYFGGNALRSSKVKCGGSLMANLFSV